MFNAIIKRLPLKCGGSVSIQASEYHYCTPRNNDGPYSEWEIGYPEGCPEEALDLLDLWGGDDGIYAYVPTEVVAAFVKACGGAAGMLLHPFALPSTSPTRALSAYQRKALQPQVEVHE